MLVWITNRKGADQTASSEAVWSGSALYGNASSVQILGYLPYIWKNEILNYVDPD